MKNRRNRERERIYERIWSLSRLRRRVPRDWSEYYGRVCSIRLVPRNLCSQSDQHPSLDGLRCTLAHWCDTHAKWHTITISQLCTWIMLWDKYCAATLWLWYWSSLSIGWHRHEQLARHKNNKPTLRWVHFLKVLLTQSQCTTMTSLNDEMPNTTANYADDCTNDCSTFNIKHLSGSEQSVVRLQMI